MAERSEVEQRFLDQYASLDDDVLREIAAGDAPWTEEGRYLHAARRAAARILRERGVSQIPRVPDTDPAEGLTRTTRVLAVLMIVAIGIGALAMYPSPEVDEVSACARLERLVESSNFASRYRLVTQSCQLQPDGALELTACIVLDERNLAALKEGSNPFEVARVKAFAQSPTPGRHCARGLVMGRVVEPHGRPWHVELVRGHP